MGRKGDRLPGPPAEPREEASCTIAPRDEHTEIYFLTDEKVACLAIVFWFPEA